MEPAPSEQTHSGRAVLNDDFHAAILRPSARRAVVCHGRALALAGSNQSARADALSQQIGLHRVCAALRQALIVIITAGAVGVALDECSPFRILVEKRG